MDEEESDADEEVGEEVDDTQPLPLPIAFPIAVARRVPVDNKSGVALLINMKCPLTGKVYQLQLRSSDSIDDVKLRMQVVDGLRPDQQRLIFAGKQLEDGRTLADYSVKNGDTIQMIPSLRGC